MLADRLTELLTAFVDGELSTRQRKYVHRLLRRSAEARLLLRELRHDAGRLRALPRVRLGREFTEQVLRSVAEPRVPPARLVRPVQKPGYPAWAGLATAAAVLLVVGTASYLYFSASTQSPTKPGVVKAKPEVQPVPDENPEKEPEKPAPQPEKEPKKPPVQRPGLTSWALTHVGQWSAERIARAALSPDAPAPDPIGSRSTKRDFFNVATPRGLLLLNMHKLDEEKPRQQLDEELRRENGFRLELFCHDSARAFARLQVVLQKHGIQLVIDKAAQTALNKHQRKSYVVYAEDLTADEVSTILRQVGREDQKHQAKGDARFDSLFVNPLLPDDYKELAGLMGVETKVLQPLGMKFDPGKHVSAGTKDQVVRALSGIKTQGRVVLVMVAGESGTRSKEVKWFLDSRKERRTRSVAVMWVLKG